MPEFTPGKGRSTGAVVPARNTELIIDAGWKPVTIHKIAGHGHTPAKGINWKGPNVANLTVHPGRPFRAPVPKDCISIEITYSTENDYNGAWFGFRQMY